MSTAWKWILGIAAALIIIVVVAAAAFVWWNHSPLTIRGTSLLPPAYATPGPNAPQGQTTPGTPYGYNYNRRFRTAPWGMPMMGRGGFGRFGAFGIGLLFLGGFLRLLIPIGLLVLVAVLFYQIGKRAGGSTKPAPSNPPDDKSPPAGRKVAKS